MFARYVYQVVNRQTANILLFKALLNLKLTGDSNLIAKLVQQADELIKGWRLLEKTVVKAYCLNRNQLTAKKLAAECDNLFSLEIKMWNMLLG